MHPWVLSAWCTCRTALSLLETWGNRTPSAHSAAMPIPPVVGTSVQCRKTASDLQRSPTVRFPQPRRKALAKNFAARASHKGRALGPSGGMRHIYRMRRPILESPAKARWQRCDGRFSRKPSFLRAKTVVPNVLISARRGEKWGSRNVALGWSRSSRP